MNRNTVRNRNIESLWNRIEDVYTLMVTLPGEPLLQLGWEVRNDSMDLGFNNTLLAGYVKKVQCIYLVVEVVSLIGTATITWATLLLPTNTKWEGTNRC